MTELLMKAFSIAQKQWQLLLFIIVVTVTLQMDYGIVDENFGFVILLGIPSFLWIIFSFCLPKLIHHKNEHPNATLTELFKIYYTYIPKLFFPIIGLMLLVVALMTILITMVYGIFNVLGIENNRSIFESGPTDLNYIIFYLFFNIALAFFSFQTVLYFFKKHTFFYALKSSVVLAKKHIPFTIGIGIAYFITMIIMGLIGADTWYKNLVVGIINGIQYYFFAAVILLYFEEKVKE